MKQETLEITKMELTQDTEQERQDKINACVTYIEIENEVNCLNFKFRELFDTSDGKKELNEIWIRNLFLDVVAKKFSSKVEQIELNREEREEMGEKHQFYLKSILISKSGIGILESEYSRRGRYDLKFEEINFLLNRFGERIKEKLGEDNFNNLCEFIKLFQELKILDNYYIKIPLKEIEYIVDKRFIGEDNSYPKENWNYFINFHRGELSLRRVRNDVKDSELDRILKSYWYEHRVVNLGDKNGILLYSFCKNKLLSFLETIKAKQESYDKHNEAILQLFKDRYKDELMLIALKESNKK